MSNNTSGSEMQKKPGSRGLLRGCKCCQMGLLIGIQRLVVLK